MSDITLSLLGIYNQRPDVLDNFHLPTGVSTDVLLPLLLSETAELEILYPEPDTLKTIVGAWSTARLASWEKMYTALTQVYDPLSNYDRTEVESGTDTGTVKTDDDISDSGTGSSSLTNVGDVTGYNSNTFADASKQTSTGSSSSSASRERDNLETRNLARSRNLHAYGNIGVTTNAEMLAGELDVRKTDIYRIICDEFTRYFCLLIY